MSNKYVKLDDVIKMFCKIDCGSFPCVEECNDIRCFKSLETSETSNIERCEFCDNHEDGDTLYETSDWDGGIGFDYIRNIHYCPICGRRLKKAKIKF